jgi:hypothetical protein
VSPAVTVAVRALALRDTLPETFHELSLTDQINVEDYARARYLAPAHAWERILSARRAYARGVLGTWPAHR